MAYSKLTDFASKDFLLTGNPDKIIRGVEINDELTAIETELATGVAVKTGAAGSVKLPAGTQLQRDVSPAPGYIRFNTTSNAFEGYDGSAWEPLGYLDGVALVEHTNTMTANYTVGAGNNAISAGPVSISPGVVVTVPLGSTWVIA